MEPMSINIRKIRIFFIFVQTFFMALYSSVAFSVDSTGVETFSVSTSTAKPYFTYTWPGDCMYASVIVGGLWGIGIVGTGTTSNNISRADSSNASDMNTVIGANPLWQQTGCPPTTHNGNSNVQTFAVAMYQYTYIVGSSDYQDFVLVCCPIDMVFPN